MLLGKARRYMFVVEGTDKVCLWSKEELLQPTNFETNFRCDITLRRKKRCLLYIDLFTRIYTF